jgi:succinate dehydrogenase/fumarate reductase cytochrome b subunit
LGGKGFRSKQVAFGWATSKSSSLKRISGIFFFFFFFFFGSNEYVEKMVGHDASDAVLLEMLGWRYLVIMLVTIDQCMGEE